MAETQDQAMSKMAKESKHPQNSTPPRRHLPPLRNAERHTKATSSLQISRQQSSSPYRFSQQPSSCNSTALSGSFNNNSSVFKMQQSHSTDLQETTRTNKFISLHNPSPSYQHIHPSPLLSVHKAPQHILVQESETNISDDPPLPYLKDHKMLFSRIEELIASKALSSYSPSRKLSTNQVASKYQLLLANLNKKSKLMMITPRILNNKETHQKSNSQNVSKTIQKQQTLSPRARRLLSKPLAAQSESMTFMPSHFPSPSLFGQKTTVSSWMIKLPYRGNSTKRYSQIQSDSENCTPEELKEKQDKRKRDEEIIAANSRMISRLIKEEIAEVKRKTFFQNFNNYDIDRRFAQI